MLGNSLDEQIGFAVFFCHLLLYRHLLTSPRQMTSSTAGTVKKKRQFKEICTHTKKKTIDKINDNSFFFFKYCSHGNHFVKDVFFCGYD